MGWGWRRFQSAGKGKGWGPGRWRGKESRSGGGKREREAGDPRSAGKRGKGPRNAGRRMEGGEERTQEFWGKREVIQGVLGKGGKGKEPGKPSRPRSTGRFWGPQAREFPHCCSRQDLGLSCLWERGVPYPTAPDWEHRGGMCIHVPFPSSGEHRDFSLAPTPSICVPPK